MAGITVQSTGSWFFDMIVATFFFLDSIYELWLGFTFGPYARTAVLMQLFIMLFSLWRIMTSPGWQKAISAMFILFEVAYLIWRVYIIDSLMKGSAVASDSRVSEIYTPPIVMWSIGLFALTIFLIWTPRIRNAWEDDTVSWFSIAFQGIILLISLILDAFVSPWPNDWDAWQNAGLIYGVTVVARVVSMKNKLRDKQKCGM